MDRGSQPCLGSNNTRSIRDVSKRRTIFAVPSSLIRDKESSWIPVATHQLPSKKAASQSSSGPHEKFFLLELRDRQDERRDTRSAEDCGVVSCVRVQHD